MTQVTLDESEMERIREIARKMNDLAFDKNINPKAHYPHGPRQVMLEHRINGCAAKAAFAKLFDCEYDPVIGEGGRYTGRGEKVYDFLVEGWFVKVNLTYYLSGKLIGQPDYIHNPPDYFALMVGTAPQFVFKGFMASSELLRNARYVAHFHKTGNPGYIASQDELLPALP